MAAGLAGLDLRPEQGHAGMSVDTPGVQLVVFDLGRVLVRICDDWQHACRYAGFDIDPLSLLPHAGRMKELSHALEVGEISFEEFAGQISRCMEASPHQVRAASEAYILGAYPGAVQMVDALNAAGVATACLTN